jgi:hypothetical protein
MCESASDINQLESQNNQAIMQLLKSIDAITNKIAQAPPPTQVEDVDTITIHEPNKTIRFRLNRTLEQQQHAKRSSTWPRRKAKQEHMKLRARAKELIAKYEQIQRIQDKRQQRSGRKVPSIVVDSGATSTCIRQQDDEWVEV